MKLKALLIYAFSAALLGLSSNASADFFSSPFDWMDDDDDYYRYDRGGRGYGRDRWRRYDEWEPNYWRYRYFDDDSDDYFFDEFDGDFFGDGRGDFNFDMNMDFDTDSRFDGDYDNDYRYRGGDRRRYSRDYDRPASRYDDRSAPRYDEGRRSGYGDRYNDGRRSQGYDDRYNDDYWRNYSQRYGGSNRRIPDDRRR